MDVNDILSKCNIKTDEIINVDNILSKNNVKINDCSNNIKGFLPDNSKLIISGVKPDSLFQRVIHKAIIRAHSSGKREVNGANILVEILSEQNFYIEDLLQKQNARDSNLIYHISNMKCSNDIDEHTTNRKVKLGKSNDVSAAVDKGELLKDEEILQSYCKNLNGYARTKKIDYVIGRDYELDRTIEILLRRRKKQSFICWRPGRRQNNDS